jgi:hypothetical protein
MYRGASRTHDGTGAIAASGDVVLDIVPELSRAVDCDIEGRFG